MPQRAAHASKGVDIRRAGEVNPLIFVATPGKSGDLRPPLAVGIPSVHAIGPFYGWGGKPPVAVILHPVEIEVLRCSRIRENSGGKSARARILTNPATTHSLPLKYNSRGQLAAKKPPSQSDTTEADKQERRCGWFWHGCWGVHGQRTGNAAERDRRGDRVKLVRKER